MSKFSALGLMPGVKRCTKAQVSVDWVLNIGAYNTYYVLCGIGCVAGQRVPHGATIIMEMAVSTTA